jgi:transposase
MPAKDGEFREWRRFQALHLKSQGWCRREVAEALSVTERSVNRWFTIARDRGPEGLLSAPIPGRPPELSPQQLQLKSLTEL